MRSIVASLFLLPILLAGTSCTQDNFVELRGSTVTATVDLVVGFTDQEVRIYINGQMCYTAVLGSSAPLSGPVAQFQAEVSRGANSIVVETRQALSGAAFTRRLANITIGESDKYYLGLILHDSALSINIQSTPFIYI